MEVIKDIHHSLEIMENPIEVRLPVTSGIGHGARTHTPCGTGTWIRPVYQFQQSDKQETDKDSYHSAKREPTAIQRAEEPFYLGFDRALLFYRWSLNFIIVLLARN